MNLAKFLNSSQALLLVDFLPVFSIQSLYILQISEQSPKTPVMDTDFMGLAIIVARIG